jgi:hypothetical protein
MSPYGVITGHIYSLMQFKKTSPKIHVPEIPISVLDTTAPKLSIYSASENKLLMPLWPILEDKCGRFWSYGKLVAELSGVGSSCCRQLQLNDSY